MKCVLVVVILYFFINLISAFSWFNFRSNQETKQITDSSSTDCSTIHPQPSVFQQQNHFRNGNNSLLRAIIASNKNNRNYLSQQRIVNQQQYQFRTAAVVHGEADSINKKSSQIIPRNRFQAIVYRQHHRSFNNSLTFPQFNRVINNQIVYPRFRPFLTTDKNKLTIVNPPKHRVFASSSLTKSVMADAKPKNSSNIKQYVRPFRRRLKFSKATVTNTKIGLLPAFTTKATDNNNYSENRQRLLTDFYYQQRLREFYQHINQRNAPRAHLNIIAALRQRKRQNKQNNIPADGYYPIVLVRDLPSIE